MASLTREMERLTEDIERVRDLRRSTVEGLQSFEEARRHHAAVESERRAEEVERLRDDVRASLVESREGLNEATSRLRQELREYHTQLRGRVSEQRAAVRDDLTGAREAWARTTGAMADVVSGVRTTVAVAEGAAARLTSTTVQAKVDPPTDDLTAIPGIGPGMQERLNRSGITTFRHLAERPVDEIRSVLGELNRLAHVEDWVREAKTRLGGGSR